ncbi:helix-turn-helix domain-containing protein [bacterium]|nr:helix-turn-helix domain-containing protein [bacterium]
MPTKEEVGQRVRLARFRRDMTLKEVANRSGMSATHISEIERGKTSPTIGALQRIAAALEERPAHFVEEQSSPLAVVVRRKDRRTEYKCDASERITDIERLTADVPWGTLTVARKVSEPGDIFERPAALGEAVLYCVRGMVRYTVRGESYVLRDGDTIQFTLEDGYTSETLGDDKCEVLGFVSAPGRRGW